MADIHVFIVENLELAKALIRDHFRQDGITYAAAFDESKQQEITDALDTIQDN